MVHNVLPTKLFSFVLIAFLFVSASVSARHHRPGAAHNSLARRLPGDLSILGHLFSDTRWTFFDAGLGACGETNDDSDFIVALNAIQYGLGYPGPQCFRTITMEYNGKKARATIMDMCPECPYGALDLSRSLFRFFAPEDIGVIYGQWYFVDDSDDDDDDDPPRQHHGGKQGKGGGSHPTKPKTKPPKAKSKPPPPAPKPVPVPVLKPDTHSTPPATPDKQQQPNAKNSALLPPSAVLSPPPHGDTNKNKNVVADGLFKSATSNPPPISKATPFESELGSEHSENLTGFNPMFGLGSSIHRDK